MDFGEILQRAWQIIWKHKILWLFGIFAGCSGSSNLGSGWGGNLGGGNTSTSNVDLTNEMQSLFEQFFGNFENWQITTLIILIIIGLLLIFFLISILAVFLGTIGRIGLIHGTHLAEKARIEAEETKISFGVLMRSGLPFFWRVFFLNLLLSIGWIVGIVVVSFTLILSIIGICILIPFCCLLIPLGWAFSIYVEQANIAMIIEDLNLTQALKRSWAVCKIHFGSLLVMGLLLIIGGGIAGLILAIPFLIAFIPFFVAIAIEGTTSMTTGLIISGICLVAYLPILIVLSGGLQGYIQSAWTLTYLHITKEDNTLTSVTASESVS